ncbi:hypothetical protein [Segetibacter aerophilus]|uniref:Uncharacterized protein n=1 Tax=Segetibacter aerophilus TaxID=670293 RepID=A0A512B9U9_9BACT|nr:hypothetical protein [Segetibacter aerophilus]GEO08719.1 hypothetical protein SAE01_12150 [Segetibacter aerophilus]
MRVICIENGPLPNSAGVVHTAPMLVEGTPYEVIKFNESSYELREIATPENYSGFNIKRFIPCSDIDEIHLEKKKKASISKLFSFLK